MSEARSADLNAAYAHCRAIAKREAKNFYYSFVALPHHKSDAMCAVYAFMRKSDDISDDESLTLDQRRAAMAEWTAGWRASVYGRTSDPILLAVHDTQSRFGIPDELLEQLVAGTTLDLEPQEGVSTLPLNGAPYQAYETFDALYRYCYLVASVVGLVCIRIFEYTDPRAELLAEHTGIAFQLTNILRDVREDAERGRIYLPLDDMAAAGTNPEALLLAVGGNQPSPALLTLLQSEIARAQQYYRASEELIPLLAPDAQPAMRVLVRIYHGLLDRIAASPAAVFHERISVPTTLKLAILAPGLVQSFLARVFG
jgi:15-cis-phytoene synthase